ncbi:ethanolamine ammonia-lyase reactivating factor EutA [Weeksellaceae bacterium KMM 9713]|uniref:Ethanolamine ammonia-lyase reactivating factor EutA n=1 Tax=Profundicola chukchiensis TaxID=2961959 RepID=A0A9X4RU47_9FLAO|nr:ethanolamine ammonia-lyase reactivating factor EutA [Profundicola chukchiensis]MDG4945763.1 ethanolamine ammonia-lyase reactivating factor EutA [Profundicola chukchiensis]
MAKNFRIHEGADVHGWDYSVPLNRIAIASITDPEGQSANREITSIPSPFARMDLVNTAFELVVELGLEGETIHHKMVSDALDVGQLFFEIDKFRDDLEIIDWNVEEDLQNLLNGSKSHKILGDTYRLYLEQDADVYNFKDMKRIFLLNYKKEGLHIIGATSPVSLFFTSANDLNLNLFIDADKQAFKGDFIPLHKRKDTFIKYLYSLKLSNPNFSKKFRNLSEYLDETFKVLTEEQKAMINGLNNDSIQDFDSLSIHGGLDVEVLGFPLKKAKPPVIKSDFQIDPQIAPEGKLPLVLPAAPFTKSLFYINGTWPSGQKAAIFDTEAIDKRKLPFDGTVHPYLVLSDFLDDYIVETEFPLNSNYFFTAGNENKNYLLPIKPLFFQYFDVDFLKTSIQGKKIVEFTHVDKNMVEFCLRIPIKKGSEFIEYRRRYYKSVSADFTQSLSKEENKGVIIKNKVNVVITPFYKFQNENIAEYNIGLYDANIDSMFDNITTKLEFYNSEGEKINIPLPKQRIYKEETNFDLITYIVNSNIAYLILDNGYTKAVLVPNMPSFTGGTEFIFGVDFGTTNTHIEYRSSDMGVPKPFEIDHDHTNMIGNLILENDQSKEIVYVSNYHQDFFPRKIKKSLDLNENSKYSFPQKTSISGHNNLNYDLTVGAYSTNTIPFKYGIDSFTRYEKISTNLKWDVADINNEKKLKVFIEQLIKMIRDKVIVNNGDLAKTKIVWSYPTSMQTFILNRLRSTWEEVIEKYLGNNIQVKSVSESLTPFYYYKNAEGVTDGIHPVVSLDIGGKTTDLAIYKGGEPILYSSYQFGGDAIFGDNYNRNININGYVNQFYDEIIQKLKSGIETANKERVVNYKKTIEILSNIKASQNSIDLIDAFFSLKENILLKDLDVDFNKILASNNKFSSLMFIFFTANMYHLAKIFKANNLTPPKEIKLAGNGSKVLSILDSSSGKSALSKLASSIFSEVLISEKVNVKLSLPKDSKQISAKGATYMFDAGLDEDFDIDDIHYIFFGEDMENKYCYNDENELLDGVENEFTDFLNLLYNIIQNDNLRDLFNIDRNYLIEAVNQIRENTMNKLAQGFNLKTERLSENERSSNLSETPFFYPLVGSLAELAYEISKND